MSNIFPFSIKELFASLDNYVIPIYQRNYTWRHGEIKQLIQDVYDYAFDHKPTQPYYIGSLIVFERTSGSEMVYETIDGQQRLTTLKILLHAIHHNFKLELLHPIPLNLELNFDSRKKSTATLLAIANGKIEDHNAEDYNVYIKQRYLDAVKILKNVLNNENVNTFYQYLVEQVFLIRVPVPPQTDLNHYFEIMNNRGEQLEKHEVLKASLLSVLQSDQNAVYTFNSIWEACADMERYVQYGFSTPQRNVVFSTNWNTLNSSNFDELCHQLVELNNEIEAGRKGKTTNSQHSTEQNILEITAFEGKFEVNEDHQDDAPERFNSVINFSNFLLHVLRIKTQKDISLDDKRLKYFFDAELKILCEDEKIAFVKDFGFSLLKAKFLFDQYIIKREFVRDKNQWSLKSLKCYDQNRIGYVNTFGQVEDDEPINKEILMLLAMFHVSAPTLVYKHWLNAALYYLFYESEITANKFKVYLQQLAQAYLFDRFTAYEATEYFDMIYINKGQSKNKAEGNYDLSLLDRGTAVENFVFNYLDYILWEKKDMAEANTFEFTFRSSVEHYYPQNPISKEHKIAASIYDLFGNLCLISNSKNSRLSNYMPAAKKDHYNNVNADSLKQSLMMKQSEWTEEQIRKHGELMKEKIESFSI